MPHLRLPLMLALFVLLAGCGVPGAAQPPSPTPAGPPSATATPHPTATPPSPTPAGPGGELGAPITLRVGETAAVGPLTLTLTAIENDSRCPTQVSCVWEGAAEAQIEVAAAGRPGEAATLTLNGQNRETEQSRVLVAGHIIRLTALDPYPAAPEPIPQGDYVATFVVEVAAQARQ